MIPDIVEIKRLCASGQWYTKIENGQILLHDTVAGETVCIGQADAEPVRYGRWIFYSKASLRGHNVWMCSECDTSYNYVECMNYCPNCGAKMED